MATGGQTENDCSLISVAEVTLQSSNENPWYRGIVVVSNKIFVIDSDDYKVCIHGLQDGRLLYKSDGLESEPMAVCIINDSEIAVILKNGLIKMFSSHTTPVIRWTMDLRVRGGLDRYTGVVSFNGDLVVCGVKENTVCWCIVSSNDGRVVGTIHQICKVKSSSSSFMTAKHNIIYISCDVQSPDTGVYGYDVQNPSKYKYIYKHKDLKYPKGIAIDQQGSLFVCNYYPYCIHHLTTECQLVSIVRQGIPRDPDTIFCDEGFLYVTSWLNNQITRYRIRYTGLLGNHRGQGEPGVSQEGKLKAVIDQTQTMQTHRKLAELAMSVGIIKTPGGSGTGFRVGPNYVMTARHVVEPIMQKVPFLQQQQPQLIDQHQLNPDNVVIDFSYELNIPSSDPNHIYYFEPEIVYESVDLDTVILKLKPDTKVYPPPLSKFADVTRLSQDKSHRHLIGHTKDDIKKTDIYDIVTLTPSDIDKARKWSMDVEKVNGYDGIENQQCVLFHCSFGKGASGSPGFWINPGDGEAYVELMMLCGYPTWLHDKYQGNTRGIPNNFLVEQGVSMRSVYDDVKARDELLCNTVFGTR